MPMNKYGEIVRNSSPPPPISSYENHRNNNGNNTGGNGSIIAIAVGITILVVTIALIIIISRKPYSANKETQITSSGYQSDNEESGHLLESVSTVQSDDATPNIFDTSDNEVQGEGGEFFVKEHFTNKGNAFYGIWCDASRDIDTAYKYVVDWESKGWDAYVFFTSEWSNLNQENWYAVSVGIYSSEEDALQYLKEIQKSQSDAYIKFSGEYQE